LRRRVQSGLLLPPLCEQADWALLFFVILQKLDHPVKLPPQAVKPSFYRAPIQNMATVATTKPHTPNCKRSGDLVSGASTPRSFSAL
jgi:hypothetical protein